MLVPTWQRDEEIVIDNVITLKVVEIRGDKVRLGIEVPFYISASRREIHDRCQQELRQLSPATQTWRAQRIAQLDSHIQALQNERAAHQAFLHELTMSASTTQTS
jgi:carbon storage regulator